MVWPNAGRPPIRIGVGEELTRCIHCNTRTETYGERTDEGEAVDFCGECGQNYIIEEDENDPV